jgi:hypothetical protein
MPPRLLLLRKCMRSQGPCRDYPYQPEDSAVHLGLRARRHLYPTQQPQTRHMLLRDESQIKMLGIPHLLSVQEHRLAAPLHLIVRPHLLVNRLGEPGSRRSSIRIPQASQHTFLLHRRNNLHRFEVLDPDSLFLQHLLPLLDRALLTRLVHRSAFKAL